MTLKIWTIYETATPTNVIESGLTLDDAMFADPSDSFMEGDPGEELTTYAYPNWDAGTMSFVESDHSPDLHRESFNGTAWVDDLDKCSALVIKDIKTTAENLKMEVITEGLGKNMEYDYKRLEAVASAGVSDATLNALSDEAAYASYPFAWAEKQVRGVNLSVIIGEYRTVEESTRVSLMQYAAVERDAVLRVAAASSYDDMQAEMISTDWGLVLTLP